MQNDEVYINPDRNWIGDQQPETCRCGNCGQFFKGDQHRQTCAICANPEPPSPSRREYSPYS